MSVRQGWLCGPKVYEYEGWLFQIGYSGPWPLCKDGESRKRAGRVFWGVVDRWQAEPDPESFRVCGGCQRT